MHVYVHVPFCARRCSYCDFSIAVRRSVPSAEFAALVTAEWRAWQSAPWWTEVGAIETIYFGGGTPSRLDPGAIGHLIAAVRADRPVAADAEVTLEANPEDVTAAAAAGWVAAGVNRISLGVQSFHAESLAWMHRSHGVDWPRKAVAELRRAGITNVSLDLIYALPDTLGRDWTADLDAAFSLEPEHLSFYGLTVEERTPLGRWVDRGTVQPALDQRAAAEYLEAHARLARAGFRHYEVSNAARPGFESRHNRAYWRRATYLGLGPSAHGAHGRDRWWNIHDWAEYRRVQSAGRSVVAGSERLDSRQVALEEAYLGLRTDQGLPADRVDPGVAAELVGQGWANRTGARIVLTAEGWLRLDAIAGRSLVDAPGGSGIIPA